MVRGKDLPSLWADADNAARKSLEAALWTDFAALGWSEIRHTWSRHAIQVALGGRLVPGEFTLSDDELSLVGARGTARDKRPSDHDAAGRAARALRPAPRRMTRRSSRPAERATEREVKVLEARVAEFARDLVEPARSTTHEKLGDGRQAMAAATQWVRSKVTKQGEGLDR